MSSLNFAAFVYGRCLPYKDTTPVTRFWNKFPVCHTAECVMRSGGEVHQALDACATFHVITRVVSSRAGCRDSQGPIQKDRAAGVPPQMKQGCGGRGGGAPDCLSRGPNISSACMRLCCCRARLCPEHESMCDMHTQTLPHRE